MDELVEVRQTAYSRVNFEEGQVLEIYDLEH